MRLARRSVQRHFAAAAQRHAKGRDHHRLGRELDELRHVLELADHHVHLIPLLILHRHQQQHDVGADGEVRRVVADDEGVKFVARAARLEHLRGELNNVGAQRVHLGVKLDASRRRRQDRPATLRIRLHHAVGFLCDRHAPDAGRNLLFLHATGGEIEVGAAAGVCAAASVYQLVWPAASKLLHVGGDRLALLLHALHRGRNADRIPQLERPHLPVEAHAHGAVDFDDVVADLRNPVGRVGKHLGEAPSTGTALPCRALPPPKPVNMRTPLAQRIDSSSPSPAKETWDAARDGIPVSSNRSPAAVSPSGPRSFL